MSEGSKAIATLKAYSSDWSAFCSWAGENGLEALPAAPRTLLLYLDDIREVAKVSTTARRLSAIAHAHRSAQCASPTDDGRVRAALAHLRRDHGRLPQATAPMTVPLLGRVVARLPTDLSGLRDRALLLLGFAGALSRSQLVAIDAEDLAAAPGALWVTLDDRSAGSRIDRSLAIPETTEPAMCPVRAVESWREEAGIAAGPLFRAIDRHGRAAAGRLSAAGVNRIVHRAVARLGSEAGQYSAHSLRVGGLVAGAMRAGGIRRTEPNPGADSS